MAGHPATKWYDESAGLPYRGRMTPAERRALAFFAAVGALGLGARAAGLGAPPPAALPGDGAVAERDALARQLAAVDSARVSRPGRGGGRKARTPRRRATADTGLAPAASVAVSTPLTPAPDAADTRPRAALPRPAGVLDADRADSADFERLPGVGPALARRLVADRRARGPFGSMAGLSRVPGVGPALERRLAPLVRFSGSAVVP